MQPTASNSDSRLIFPYNVHNQAGFDNTFINGRGFILFYSGIILSILSIYRSSRLRINKDSQNGVIFDYTPIIAGRWKSGLRFLNLNVSGTNDRFPSVEDHIHATLLLLSMPGQPQDILLQEVLRNLRSNMDF